MGEEQSDEYMGESADPIGPYDHSGRKLGGMGPMPACVTSPMLGPGIESSLPRTGCSMMEVMAMAP